MIWVGIQARLNSTRLPEKSIKTIKGRYLIDYAYRRCQVACDNVALLIPDNESKLMDVCKSIGYYYYEGSPSDLTARYYGFALEQNASHVIRVTGDCPLINPANISHTIHLIKSRGADFISNCIKPCTDGQEVEAISTRALDWLNFKASGSDREHVTTYIKNNEAEFIGDGFNILSWSETYPVQPKMSVDTQEDFDHVKQLIEEQNV